MLRTSLLLTAFCFASAASAQVGNDYGSVYSRFALGQRYDLSTSQADAMGVSGVALRAGLYNGLANPALGADQTLTTFSASGAVRGVRATDASDATSDATAGDLALVQVGVPLIPGKLGLSLGYRPYSRVDYRATSDGEIVSEDETIPYRSNLEGSGGLQRLSVGLGTSLFEGALTLGASAETIVGTIEYVERTEFPTSTSAYTETRRAEATRLYGFTGTFGAAFTARSLARETDALTFAGALTLPTTLNASRAITLGTSLDRDTLSTSADGDVRIPLTARFGVAYASGPKFTATADAVYEPWQDFESDFSFGGFNPASGTDDLRSRVRVGGGVEWTPGGGERNASYFQRVSYRLGAYSETSLVAPEAQDVLARALTGGLSLPTRIGGSRIDLGFEVGTRGGTEGVLVRDRFWRGTLTFNFGERWFVRRRLG